MWVMSLSCFVSVLVSFSRTFSLLPVFPLFSSWFCYLQSHIQLGPPVSSTLVPCSFCCIWDYHPSSPNGSLVLLASPWLVALHPPWTFGSSAVPVPPPPPIRLLLPFGFASVLTHTSFTSVLQHPSSTLAAHQGKLCLGLLVHLCCLVSQSIRLSQDFQRSPWLVRLRTLECLLPQIGSMGHHHPGSLLMFYCG